MMKNWMGREVSMPSVLDMWSASRPTVPTTTERPLRMRAFSDFFFSPPMSSPATSQWNGRISCCSTSCT